MIEECDNCHEEKEVYYIGYHQTCLECYDELIESSRRQVTLKQYQ